MRDATDVPTVDHETRLDADDHFALKLWLRILTCTHLIESQIRHNLRREFDSTLPRFDLLAQLDRSDALKMSELSQRLMVTGGNVTGLADQLQHEGWLVREPVENDRRATRLRLTDAGRERFAGMARTHEGWVVDLLGALSREEQAQLHRLLGKLKLGLRGGPAGGNAPEDTADPADPAGDDPETRPARRERAARATGARGRAVTGTRANGARRPLRRPHPEETR